MRTILDFSSLFYLAAIARRLSKQKVREAVARRFEEGREDDVEMFVAFVMQDAVQAGLGKYVESLKAKAKK